MKKIVKIAGAVLVVLLAVALILPVVLRGKIGEIVKYEADRMLTAKLDFSRLDISLLRHFPNASLDLEDLTLVAGGRFEGDTVVAARRISVVVDLMSLFSDEGFEVGRVVVDRPSILARKDAEGAVNWDVMRVDERAEVADTPAEEAADASGPSSFRLALRDLRVDRAQLRYIDDSSAMRCSVSPLTLRLRGALSASRTTLRCEVDAADVRYEQGGTTLLGGVDAALRAEVDADLERMRFTLSDNSLSINAVELALDGWVDLGGEVPSMDFSLRSSRVGLRELLSLVPAFYLRDFASLRASGDLSLGAWVRGELRGDRLPAFEASLGVSDGEFKYAGLPQAVTGIALSASATNPGGTADATVIDLSDFRMTMAGNSLRASLHAATPLSDLQFRAAAAGRIDLGAIKQVYPLDDSVRLSGLVTLDVQAEGRMSDLDEGRIERVKASGDLVVEDMTARIGSLPEVEIRRMAATLSPQALALDECRLKVGASDLQATGRLTGYMGYLLRDDVLGGRLSLRSTLLDLNELLGIVPASDASDGEQPAAEPAADEGNAALSLPRNLDLRVDASLDKVLSQKMILENLVGALTLRDGTLSMDKLRMKAFGGSLAASGSYASAAAAPRAKFSLDFADASFAQTFAQLDVVRRMVPLFEKTGGDYSMRMELDTQLDESMEPDLKTLDASGELRSSNVRLQNLEVFDKLATTLGNDKLRSIEAGNLRIAFTVRDGRLATKPFDIRLGDASVNLSGTTGLDRTIDYTAVVSLPGKAAGVLNHIDVGIGGTFSSPKITVDVKEVLKQGVTQAVNEQIQKLTGSENLSAEIERQAAKLRDEARKAGEKLVAAAEEQKAKLVEKASGPIARIAAEKAGDALVKEARKQAENLSTEAERQIARLQSGGK